MAEAGGGQEFKVDDKVGWSTLMVERGQVIEVYIPRSNLTIQVDQWCSFVVMNVSTQADGSMVLEVRFLGCEDGEVSKLLEEEMNGRKKRGLLHLCPSQPCTEVIGDPFTIHVLEIRVWDFDAFTEPPYMDAKLRTRVRQWLRRDRPTEEDEPVEDADPLEAMKKPAAKQPPRVRRTPKAKVRKDPGENPAGGKKLTEAMRDKLRGRLREVREKAGAVKAGDGEPEDVSSADPVPTTPPSDLEGLDCAVAEEPRTGTILKPKPPSLALAVAEGDKKVSKEKKKAKKKVDSTRVRERTDKLLALEDDLGEAVTSAITSRGLRGQLVRRALLTEKLKNNEKRRKKGKKDASKKLREALTEVLSPKEKKKKKRKKSGKRRKRRRLADGVIESCSSSYSSSSEEEEEDPSSSSEDLETPMRRRSRDKPGSVLKMLMLTQHVQEQLEQAATTEVGAGEDSLTGGVKIQTYFALQIRPSFQNSLREMREMHHLASVMDALRRGEIAKVGDALAARFMAIHQSLLDQNWSTARFMEIFPLEDASAASSSLVLATRKHTKLVAKVQGLNSGGGWFGPLRKGGKGGKGQWYYGADAKGDGKDGKGKGKKGKDRKGKGDQWNAANNEWKDRKEKPDEK